VVKAGIFAISSLQWLALNFARVAWFHQPPRSTLAARSALHPTTTDRSPSKAELMARSRQIFQRSIA
jgi:hypothetical protein